MGLLDKLDVSQTKLWKSVDVIDTPEMEEPHVLQQKVIYPTEVSPKAETTAPTDEHRLVPLSKLLESEPSFWEKVSDSKGAPDESDSSEKIPDIIKEDMESE